MHQPRKQVVHRWSQLFIPTLREAPSDAEVASHKLLLRGGYIRQLGAGIYSHLFLGSRSINKIVAIVREEMDTIGQEFLLPAIHPREIWEASGRWTGMGDNMFRLKDRKGADLCLGMTHEEVMTDIARHELRSYKQLPQIWYQIQTKFRDEPRPKSGLLRVRQFLMKDAYSFDIDEAGLDASYDTHDAVYRRIFERCGLEFVAVEADSGSMGGSQSQEFMVYTEAGEDLIASCPNCHYAANVEKAEQIAPPVLDLAPIRDGQPLLVGTPNARTIDEVVAYIRNSAEHEELRTIAPGNTIKTLAYMVSGWSEREQCDTWRRLIVLVRGDQKLNETKLGKLIDGFKELQLMNAEQIEVTFGASPGFLGPINLKPVVMERLRGLSQIEKPLVVIDESLRGRKNLIAGANEDGFHLANIDPVRDFKGGGFFDVTGRETWGPMAEARDGDTCPRCVDGKLKVGKAVEIGHIFKLGYKYSKSMGASVLNRDGKEVTPIMGSYGIGIERILTAAIETSAAKFAAAPDGKPGAQIGQAAFVMPPSISPFEVVVTITNVKEPELLAAGENIAMELADAGFDVLLDDRDERAGVKFKDAELIGVPYRINVGKKLAEGKIELVDRLTGTTSDIPLADLTSSLRLTLPQQT